MSNRSEQEPQKAPVVAAVVERGGRYLVGLRPAEKRHGGLWEFPGGKLDAGEDAVDAARRELAEELGLRVTSVAPDPLHAIADPAAPFVICFHRVRVTGEPRAIEHEAVGWYALSELADMPLAPADARFVAWLASNDS